MKSPNKWRGALGVIAGVSGIALLGLLAYLYFWQPKPDEGLLAAPVLRDKSKPTSTAIPTDKFNPGEFTGYRLAIVFPGNKLNPYPLGVTRGQVQALDTNSQIVPINGAVAIDQSNLINERNLTPGESDFTNPYSAFFASSNFQYIPEVKSVVGGYVPGKKPVPLRYGSVSFAFGSGQGSVVLEMRDGVAEFTYINDGYPTGHRTFNVTGFELKDEEGKFTLLPPPTLLDNLLYPKELRGSSVTSQQSFAMAEFAEAEQPVLTPEFTTTHDHYYTITSNVDSIVRDPKLGDQEITLTIKPVALYPKAKSIEERYRAELQLMPAYPEPAVPHATYAAEYKSIKVDGQVREAERGEKVSGRTSFEIGPDGAEVTLTTNKEPSLLGYLGFDLTVGPAGPGSNVGTMLRPSAFNATTTHFIPMTTAPNRGPLSLPPLVIWLIIFHLAQLTIGSLLTLFWTRKLTGPRSVLE